MSGSITAHAKKNYVPKDNNLYVIIAGKVFSEFTSFQFTRDLEQMPGTFSMVCPCDFTSFPALKQQDVVHVYINKKQIFTGYLEMFSITAAGNSQHQFTAQGRSKLRDICDSNIIVGGTSLQNITGMSDICQAVCTPLGVNYLIKSKSNSTTWQTAPYNLSDTGQTIIARYALYEAKLIYENGYGALVVDDIGTVSSSTPVIDSNSPVSAIQFSSDATQRYAEYQVYWQPMTTLTQTGLPPYASAKDPESNLFPASRIKVLFNSSSDDNGSLSQRVANWTANRNYGRATQVQFAMPGWQGYDVNQIIKINRPEITVNAEMVIASITLSYDSSGTNTSYVCYPKEAFSFEPVVLYNSSAGLQSLPEN